jgi:RimJ/RimL family protein N-acetyltransferase
LYELNPSEYGRVRPLFAGLAYNLAIESILNGFTPARIFVDDKTSPSVSLIQAHQKLFLAGTIGGNTGDLSRLIGQTILPGLKSEGCDAIYLHVDSPSLKGQVEEICEGLFPVERQRMYLECTQLKQDWRGLLPKGYSLREIDESLVAMNHLANIDYLREELCSERPSVEDFLEKSFGYCILQGEALASWCLSEYNVPGRCEVGVATVDEHQQRGLATAATLALVEHALSHGIHKIGWHCWSHNTASVALALKAGFEKVRDYSVYLSVFDLGVQYALKGDDFRSAGNHREALAWYQKAINEKDPPPWVYIRAACCQAQLGDKEAAFDSLRHAMEAGFDGMDEIGEMPELASLRTERQWEAHFNSPD